MANPDHGKADKLRLALAELEKQCDVAPGTLALGANDGVTIQPSPNEKYDKIDCIARGLLKPEFADHVKIGFVGNGAAAPEEKE